MRSIFLSGSSGFVGSEFLKYMKDNSKFKIVRGVRRLDKVNHNFEIVEIGNLESCTIESLTNILMGIDVVIHLAGKAHISLENVHNDLAEYERINYHGTINLAKASANAGVRRFIFLSSIKVNGENTPLNMPIKVGDVCHPSDTYAVSKFNAELALRRIQKETGMEIVVIRPPLIYGPGVKGNFLKLLKIINLGIPLPFKKIVNKRSLIFVGNLADIILKCIDTNGICEKELLVSDGEDLSTPELIGMLASLLQKPVRMFSFPYLFLIFNLFGKQAEWNRISGSLRVDDIETRRLLNWVPPFSVQQGMFVTVNSFLDGNLIDDIKTTSAM